MIRVDVSPRADADLGDVTDYYLTEAGYEVAANFLAAWDRAATHLGAHPDSGSLRLANAAKLPDLRVWPVMGFPYLALYVRHGTTVTILRVLHAARDIPTSLQE